MTDREVQEFIEENARRGSRLGLESVRELAGRMGHPEESLKVIHIAGTNGKGSILAYLSSILQEAGYRVGSYLSPVISDYREKIQVNGKMIGRTALAEGFDAVRECMAGMEAQGLPLPTLFEMETVLACWYFKKKKCDYVILEAGMGGETDATNLVDHPLLCIFASISMDHMAYLGNTLAEIASVKAGIMKDGACAVSARQKEEAAAVLREHAERLSCELVFADVPEKIKYSIKKTEFCYKDYKKCKTTLAGVWQPENAAVALEAVEALKRQGCRIPAEAVYRGLGKTVWQGRFTVLLEKPLFIMDGAHNEDAALRLRESILTYLRGKPLIYIMGVLKDKEYGRILENTADLASQIITVTPPNNPRALGAYELAAAARDFCKSVTNADSLEEAVEMALLLAGQECAIIAFGSLSYLGALSKIVEKKKLRS